MLEVFKPIFLTVRLRKTVGIFRAIVAAIAEFLFVCYGLMQLCHAVVSALSLWPLLKLKNVCCVHVQLLVRRAFVHRPRYIAAIADLCLFLLSVWACASKVCP